MQHALLIELLTEELPPKALYALGTTFTNAVRAGLAEAAFAQLDPEEAVDILATPRRLAVIVRGVAAVQPERTIERKGPYVAQGINAQGKPAQALLGFAKSCGVPVEALERASDAKG